MPIAPISMSGCRLKDLKIIFLNSVRLAVDEFNTLSLFRSRYWVPPEVDPDEPLEEGEEPPEDDIQCIVYFWQVWLHLLLGHYRFSSVTLSEKCIYSLVFLSVQLHLFIEVLSQLHIASWCFFKAIPCLIEGLG